MLKKKRPDFKKFKKSALRNIKVREEYEILRPEFERIIEKISYSVSRNRKRLYLRHF